MARVGKGSPILLSGEPELGQTLSSLARLRLPKWRARGNPGSPRRTYREEEDPFTLKKAFSELRIEKSTRREAPRAPDWAQSGDESM